MILKCESGAIRRRRLLVSALASGVVAFEGKDTILVIIIIHSKVRPITWHNRQRRAESHSAEASRGYQNPASIQHLRFATNAIEKNKKIFCFLFNTVVPCRGSHHKSSFIIESNGNAINPFQSTLQRRKNIYFS